LERLVNKPDGGGFKYFLTGSMVLGFYSTAAMTREKIIRIYYKKDFSKEPV
jgi:hypothetical protein